MEESTSKTYIITGATSGIGLAIMDRLAAQGNNLIGIGRSSERSDIQQTRLQDMYPQSRVLYLSADLSIQTEIRAAVLKVNQIFAEWGVKNLDGLVNNAGTFTYWQRLTAEGFETQWAVNHLAPFLLTNLLLPNMGGQINTRVITISSGSHYGAKLNWSDIQSLGRYNPLKSYKNTKLANVIFTVELNRRLGSDSLIRAFAADPGLVNTGIGEKSQSGLARKIWELRRKKGIPPDQPAAEIINLLMDHDIPNKTGIYWKDGKPKKPNPFALNGDHGWRLWEISARMTGIG